MHTSEFDKSESQDSDFDAWSRLTTVTVFDTGRRPPPDDMEEQGVVLQDIQSFSSTSLLVESLIEQLCKFFEKDPTKRKKLYNEICHKLHKMKLIDRTYQVEEFSFMRSHYQKALFQLLSVAKSNAIGPIENSNNALVKMSTSFRFSTIHQEEHFRGILRYQSEFEELEYIARGGFGKVHKARNKLDGSLYAVKKICLRYHNIESFLRSLREVKMLAKLHHPNIVSYKAAWLEPFSPSSLSGRSGQTTSHEEVASLSTGNATRESSEKLHQVHSRSEEESWSVEFKTSRSADKVSSSNKDGKGSTLGLKSLFHEVVESHSVPPATSTQLSELSKTSESTESEDSGQMAVCKYRSQNNIWKFQKSISLRQCEWAMLYIQMQLCSRTLRHWLDQRNKKQRTPVDVKESLTIFHQIVLGVEYIHSQNIVHHDIKPSNIFVNEDLSQVQVGDFGLACHLQHSMSDVTFLTEESGSLTQLHHKGEVGTPMYAAQEQLAGKCDPKSDIYSLGIILFELLHPFSTDMERAKVVGQLKGGHLPPTITALSPNLAQMISVLVSRSSQKRPTAHELASQVAQSIAQISNESLSTTLLVQRKDETIQELLSVIAHKDEEINMLKQRLEALEALHKT